MSPDEKDAAATAEADAELERERAALLKELGEVSRKLETVPPYLRAKRLELYVKGRSLGITFQALGDAAGKSEPAVIQAVNKGRP